jgi:hypothetical protein
VYLAHEYRQGAYLVVTGPPNHESLEQAAVKTWTGRQAIAAGFTKVKIGRVGDRSGSYYLVSAYFEKP